MKILTNIGLYAILILTLSGCKKDAKPVFSGEATIDNSLYGLGPYYAIGFSFELGTELETNNTPEPDISIHAITDVNGLISGAYLDTPNLIESFALAGDFATDAESNSFFNSLKEIGQQTWLLFANEISENQVWLFKTRNENYVKIKINKLVIEDRLGVPYAEITFKWRIQPDGTPTFSE